MWKISSVPSTFAVRQTSVHAWRNDSSRCFHTRSTVQTLTPWSHFYRRKRNFTVVQVGQTRRWHVVDGRQRLSQHWVPPALSTHPDPKQDDAHVLLSKTHFIHQAYSGVYQLLPLGLRVQNKIERLIDNHMQSLGASKLSLSSLSSEGLWRRSGRLAGSNAELLKVRTRAKDAFLLSPTHEEEITKLVASQVRGPKQLPLRLYQISRKYRDERRPRQGLLRTREFVMKDLYTFDVDEKDALKTYNATKETYTAFFKTLRVPFLIAEADTGNIGGNMSHEFHFPCREGEDVVFNCDSCDYVANEELVQAYRPDDRSSLDVQLNQWIGLQKDGKTLLVVHYPARSNRKTRENGVNTHTLLKLVPDLDPGVERPLESWLQNIQSTLENVSPGLDRDHQSFRILQIYNADTPNVENGPPALPFQAQLDELIKQVEKLKNISFGIEIDNLPLSSGEDLLRVHNGDHCPRCRRGRLASTRAIELGHTFHLGTRYSEPLEAVVHLPTSSDKIVPMSMGCHGIGISRMISAIAAIMKDDVGLNWPRVCCPFEAVIIAAPTIQQMEQTQVYDELNKEGSMIDTVIDDREASLIQKMKDADLIGYPVIVVLGRDWQLERKCEIQCRRSGVKTAVPLVELRQKVQSLLDDL